MDLMSHQSDSGEQREAECYMLSALSERVGFPLQPEVVFLEPGVHVALDGFNAQHRVLCEIFAHIGRTRGAQNHKIARDILKLEAVEKALGGEWRKILCFADDQARQALTNNSWLAAVARKLRIEPLIVPLSESLQARVAGAQRRQRMVNQPGPVA
jgi:hypothetical protein